MPKTSETCVFNKLEGLKNVVPGLIFEKHVR